MFGSQRRIIDVAAVAIFLVIIAVLFWPSGGGGEDSDSDADDVAEEQTPTVEETPVDDVSPEEPEVAACETSESARTLARFVTHFNDGNIDELRELIPSRGAQSPSPAVFPGMDRETLQRFRVHESGNLTRPAEVLDYLESRHEADEIWQLQDYSIVRLADYSDQDRTELDRAEVVIQRSAENLPQHQVEGRAVIDCRSGTILLWEFSTDNLDLTLPMSVDEFLDAVGPYGTAEMRDLRILVSTELRQDGGSLLDWEIRRIDANNAAGTYVMAVEAFTRDGEQFVDFVYDGTRWYLQQRGWQESGSITGPGVLPLEHTLVNQEPTETANLIRDHLDEIPEDGDYQITGEFDVTDELSRAVSLLHGVESSLQGVIEIEIQDSNIRRTRYRVVDQTSEFSLTVVEIEWIHLRRVQQFDPGLFIRPDEFRPGERQYQPPEELADRMTFQGEIDHQDGVGERYELEWNGETVSVTVRPSRGASDGSTFGESWLSTWNVERSPLGDWTVASAGPAGANTFPHAAVWDTGNHRFELTVNPEMLNDPSAWNASQVNAIAGAMVTGDG